MALLKDLHFSAINGLRILIVGNVGSGKTALTARLLDEAVAAIEPAKITVMDMAPKRQQFKGFMVGGSLTDYLRNSQDLRFLVPVRKLHAPRIEGHSLEEVLHLARTNATIIEEMLKAFLRDPTSVLFANDVSMYLQAGDASTLLKTVAVANTFVGNSYCGLTLEDDRQSGLSERERSGLAALKSAMDKVLNLSPAGPSAETIWK